MATMTIEVDETELRERLDHQVAEWVKSTFRERLREVSAKAVQEVIDEELKAMVREVLVAILAHGWDKTDEYGRSTGKRVTVRDFALEFISKTDRYSSGGSWLDRQTGELLREALQKAVGPEIDEAKKKFKGMLDGEIHERLSKALREAMGLKA